MPQLRGNEPTLGLNKVGSTLHHALTRKEKKQWKS
jgi:hypothetical protein